MARRQCGDCQLCCKLVPVHDVYPLVRDIMHKKAGEKCIHQKVGKGCKVYNDRRRMPECCKFWNCRWIVSDPTMVEANMPRPDRCHFVVDIMPDYVTARETGQKIQVVQIWVDANFHDVLMDPHLRRYMLMMGEQNIATMIRYNESLADIILPPQMTADKKWSFAPTKLTEKQHGFQDILQALIVLEDEATGTESVTFIPRSEA